MYIFQKLLIICFLKAPNEVGRQQGRRSGFVARRLSSVYRSFGGYCLPKFNKSYYIKTVVEDTIVSTTEATKNILFFLLLICYSKLIDYIKAC